VKFAPVAKPSVCQAAGEWFLKSGIQHANGGVARYYFSDRKCNAPLTTEITAYYAGGLLALYRQSGESRYLDAALKAAWYLVRAWDAKSSAMPFECESEGSKYSYFFDNGIIVRSLLAVWREDGTSEFLSTAQKVGDSMARDFSDGKSFSPILELPSKSPLVYEPARWSRSPGCYQLKAAMGWHELGLVTNDERYKRLYRNLLAPSLASHDSFLPGVDTEIPVMDRLHAYLYFLEGLLPAVEERACADAMAEGIDRAAAFVRKISPMFLRSDVVAQLLRVRLFADQHGVLPLDENVVQKEIATLEGFQSDDADARLNGGFWFGRKNGSLLPFMNPVSTTFCSQTLEMWNQYQKGHRALQWQSLV
jgi:uncharacterized protein YyaL (SSP411 family)